MTRYIDADALIDAYCNGCTHYRGKICRSAQRCDFESFCNEYINTMPTVDAVPVKRGVWLPTFENHGFDDEAKNLALACSVCQVAFRISDYEQIEDFRYCPNCGARMDKE